MMGHARHSFQPTPVPKLLSGARAGASVTAWLRFDYGTITGSGYSSIPDANSPNPAVQSTNARRPVSGVSPSGVPMGTFANASSSSLSWPLTASNNQTTLAGYACWVKQPASSGPDRIISIGGGTLGASAQKLFFAFDTSQRLTVGLYASDSGGRQGITSSAAFTANTWIFVRWAYDSSQATEALRSKLYINEVLQTLSFSDIGVGGAVTTLRTVTGNAIIGNFNNDPSSLQGLNGSIGGNFYAIAGDLSAADGAALMNYERPDSGPIFYPQSITAVSAWLRTSDATIVAGDISVLPDFLNSNPAVQTVAARRPTLELSAGNGLRCMRFATNDVLVWPITAQSAGGASQAGWGLWVKLNAASLVQTLVSIANFTGGANGFKIRIRSSTATVQTLASPDGPSSKSCSSGNVLDTGWHFVTLEYDAGGATDAAKLVLTVDAVALGTISGAATLGALFAATGNILIGNSQDDVTPSGPLNGLIGPNIYAFASKTAGATTGLMSTAERLQLMNYQRPT